MQGIYQNYEILPGDVPLTVALDMTMDGQGTCNITTAYLMLSECGSARIVKE